MLFLEVRITPRPQLLFIYISSFYPTTAEEGEVVPEIFQPSIRESGAGTSTEKNIFRREIPRRSLETSQGPSFAVCNPGPGGWIRESLLLLILLGWEWEIVFVELPAGHSLEERDPWISLNSSDLQFEALLHFSLC